MDELLTLAAKIGDVGFPTLCILIIYGSYKRIWVWGSEYAKLEADCERWRGMALDGIGMAKSAVSIAKQQT